MSQPPARPAPEPGAEAPARTAGVDWVWRNWILHLSSGVWVLVLTLSTLPPDGQWIRFWYVLLLTGGWLLIGVVNATISRGRTRWFLGGVLAMVSPFLVLLAAAETGVLHAALLSSSVLIMLTIGVCPRMLAIAVCASGIAVAIAFKAVIGGAEYGVPLWHLLQLSGAFIALALLALTWRLFLERLHDALTFDPSPRPPSAAAAAQERDRLREAMIVHLRKLDTLIEQAGSSGRGGSG